MIRPALLTAGLVFGLVFAGPVLAQERCEAARPDAWFSRPPPPMRDEQPVLEDAQIVTEREAVALGRLAAEPAVEISDAEVPRFLGPSVRPERPGLRPYLVRAVLPNPGGGLFRVSWSGDDLHVYSIGLGCPRYIRRAVVVYLDRRPAQVFVAPLIAH